MLLRSQLLWWRRSTIGLRIRMWLQRCSGRHPRSRVCGVCMCMCMSVCVLVFVPGRCGRHGSGGGSSGSRAGCGRLPTSPVRAARRTLLPAVLVAAVAAVQQRRLLQPAARTTRGGGGGGRGCSDAGGAGWEERRWQSTAAADGACRCRCRCRSPSRRLLLLSRSGQQSRERKHRHDDKWQWQCSGSGVRESKDQTKKQQNKQTNKQTENQQQGSGALGALRSAAGKPCGECGQEEQIRRADASCSAVTTITRVQPCAVTTMSAAASPRAAVSLVPLSAVRGAWARMAESSRGCV